jgi:hypothetical protein
MLRKNRKIAGSWVHHFFCKEGRKFMDDYWMTLNLCEKNKKKNTVLALNTTVASLCTAADRMAEKSAPEQRLFLKSCLEPGK